MRKLYKKILAASAIIALIIIFLVLGFIGFNFIELLIRTNQWFYSKLGALGIYIAIFLISILGTFSIMIPVPYQLGVITALLVLPVNPLMLAIVSAAGSVIGELSSWLLGRSASAITKKEAYMSKIKGLTELIQKGYGSWLVFIYGLTPLPDDLLLIALGMEKFSTKKIIIAGFLGKFLMLCALIFTVLLAKNTVVGQGILYIYGLEFKNNAVISTGETIVSTIITIATAVITILIITVDWNKLFKKIKNINRKEIKE